MKRTLAFLLSALLSAAVLAGCGASGQPLLPPSSSAPPASVSSPASAPPASSSIPQPAIKDVYIAQLANELNAMAAEQVQQNDKKDRAELLERTRGYLQALVDANVLPSELLEQAQPYFERSALNYTRYTDWVNIDGLTCNFGMGTTPPYYIYTLNAIRTGQVLALDFSLPYRVIITAQQRRGMALATLAYLGLDAFTDWEEWDMNLDGQDALVTYTSPAANLVFTYVWHQDEPDNLTGGFHLQKLAGYY